MFYITEKRGVEKDQPGMERLLQGGRDDAGTGAHGESNAAGAGHLQQPAGADGHPAAPQGPAGERRAGDAPRELHVTVTSHLRRHTYGV